ncbi:MAG: hypothetical protein WBN32_05690 [Woeseia sp.]
MLMSFRSAGSELPASKGKYGSDDKSLMRAAPLRAVVKQRAIPWCGLLLFLASLFFSPIALAELPDTSVSVGGTRYELTVIAEDASLRAVLEYIAHHQRLAVEAYVPLHEMTSVALIEKPLSDVLRELLRNYSFTLQLSNSDAYGSRLWIYPRDGDITPPLAQPDYFGVAGLKSAKR